MSKSIIGCYLLAGYNEAKLKGLETIPYTIGEWEQITPNDKADTLYVLPGFKVTSYRGWGFEGDTNVYTAGIHKLSNTGAGNNISSIKVTFA